MTATEFGVYGLLAQKNIEQNNQLRKNLQNIENRVVPELSEAPKKEHHLVCYEYEHAGKKRVRVARNQLKEIESKDSIQHQYQENPAKKFKPGTEKKYGWLRDAEKFLQIKCPNPIMLWNKIRKMHPYRFYGVVFNNTAQTEIEFLNEEQLREKYRRDSDELLKILKKNNDKDAELPEKLLAFKNLCLADEDEAVAKCLMNSKDGKYELKKIIEETIRAIAEEHEAPDENAKDGSSFKVEDIVKFVSNHVWNFSNTVNVYNTTNIHTK